MYAKLTIVAALLAACSSGPPSSSDALLDAYETAVAAVHDLTDTLVADVEASAEVSAVGALQATSQVDMDGALADLDHVLEDLEGCQMMGDGADRVDQAQASIQAIEDATDALIEGHAAHVDAEDCHAAAEAHELEVDAEVASMESHHDAWHDADMECGDHDDMDMP